MVIPVEFLLFGATLVGVALFHDRTLEVAAVGLAAILCWKLAVVGFHGVPGLPGRFPAVLRARGDQRCDPVDGHGSMQVGNTEAKQTVFALNCWKAGGNADLGFGNSEGQTRDWTFARNAASYSVKRLRVLVRPKR